jgi:hypothetical protein
MPRTISISVSTERTDEIIYHLRGLDGVVGLAVQRDSSLDPPGDVLTVQATNGTGKTEVALLPPSISWRPPFLRTTPVTRLPNTRAVSG